MNPCPLCSVGTPQFSCKAALYPGAEREIHECPHCRASYFWPVPSPGEIGKCYPHSYFRDFFKQYWKDYYKGRALIASISRWRVSGSFLDVGCALGTLLYGVQNNSRWKVFGLEYSKAAADMGKKLNTIAIVESGLTEAPWEDARFDYIHANNVLEHEADPLNALRAAARLLNAGGRLHLTVPNGPVDSLPNRILYQRLGRAVRTRHIGHLFFFSRPSLNLLLQRAGLRVLAMRNFHFKTALKARGWTPGAFKEFFEDPAVRSPGAGEENLSLEEYRHFIPRPPPWVLYYLKAQWRRLWRFPRVSAGYDFEILAEKP